MKKRYVGIDVSAKTLDLKITGKGKEDREAVFENTPKGHRLLIKFIASSTTSAQVVLEATGMHHFDLAVTLSRQKHIEVMVLNPRASRNFSKAMMTREKSDKVDADVLLNFCKKMEFVSWTPPCKKVLDCRSFSRQLAKMTNHKAMLKNQLYALNTTSETPGLVINIQEKLIKEFEKQIAKLEEATALFIEKDSTIKAYYDLLISVPGIARTSAIQLLAELLVLPEDLSNRQWVACAGLDPRKCQSGTSLNKKARISKAGNRFLRKALYMPALSATQHDPYVKAYYAHLINDNGTTKLQAVCAVMRKLLHAIHGMFEHMKPFDNTRFFRVAAT